MSRSHLIALEFTGGVRLVWQVADNNLSALPDEAVWAPIKELQVLNLSGNELTATELEKISICCGTTLKTLQIDRNKLDSLPLRFEELQLLDTFTASQNQILEIPAGIGLLKQLMFLNLEENLIEQVPTELSQLSAKKFQDIKLKGNPLKDPRCKRILEREKLPVKPLLLYRLRPLRHVFLKSVVTTNGQSKTSHPALVAHK
jgi:Leucine-rich repeat (LRR) protein